MEEKYIKIAKKILWIGMGALVLMQIFMILYVNLFQMPYHLGYDVSSYMMKAIEVWRQKTLFIDHWYHQTTLYIDNAMPIASLLYGMTGNIFLSYGIANCIISGLLLTVFYGICKSLELGKVSTLALLNLFLCPYLMESLNNWNDLGYFSMMFTSMASYGVKTLTILTVLKIVIDTEKGQPSRLLVISSVLLPFIAGLSSGLYVAVTIMVPAYLYIGVKVLVKNDWKQLLTRQSLHLTISTVALFTGKFITEKIIGFTSMDSEMVWVSLGQFWKNITSMFVGFLQLLGALPEHESVSIMNRQGIFYVCALFIAMVCLMVLFVMLRAVIVDFGQHHMAALCTSIILFNLFLFSIVYTTYGSGSFEIRYLIEPFIALMFLTGLYLERMDDRLIFKWLLLTGMAGSLFVVDIISDHTYITTRNNYDSLREITDHVHEQDQKLGEDIPVVFVLGDDEIGDARNLRVIDESKIYRSCSITGFGHQYGDYAYFDENSEYQGPVYMLTMDTTVSSIPNYIISHFKKVDSLNGYGLYLSQENIFDSICGLPQGNYGMDFPYSGNIEVSNGAFRDDGAYETNGKEGVVLYGPDTDAVPGTYDITLHYQIMEYTDGQEPASFAVGADKSDDHIASGVLQPSNETITLSDVVFTESDNTMHYEVYEAAGTKIRMKSMEVVRKK
ncbi:MAG: hypothetical protein PHE02_00025 [Lachnospiraceae bacterium]|nr:hypothetical protein [Lachnospiraceae bacterium]